MNGGPGIGAPTIVTLLWEDCHGHVTSRPASVRAHAPRDCMPEKGGARAAGTLNADAAFLRPRAGGGLTNLRAASGCPVG